jgi:hypothetical protein
MADEQVEPEEPEEPEQDPEPWQDPGKEEWRDPGKTGLGGTQSDNNDTIRGREQR